MKKTIILSIAIAAMFVIPNYAHAWNTPCFDYCGGNHGGYNDNYYNRYNNNHGYNPYPPAPTYYTVPSYQVVYPNGYYQNYFVPTVRYFPAPAPLPVPTTYYPYGYNGGYNGGYYGGGYHY